MTSQVFDPHTAFGLFNPDKGDVTCVGYAPTKGRRCRNPPGANYSESRFLQTRLQRLLNQDLSSVDVETVLQDLAAGSLCSRYHQNQANRICSGWIQNVYDHITGASSASAASATSRTTSVVSPTTTTNLTATAATTIQTNQPTIAATTPQRTQSTQSIPTTTPSRLCTIAHVPRRSTDDDCAICMEACTDTPLSELVWCKASCGRSVHLTCFGQWQTQRAYHTSLRCVFCRATWSQPCLHDEEAPQFLGIWDAEDMGLERLFRLP